MPEWGHVNEKNSTSYSTWTVDNQLAWSLVLQFRVKLPPLLVMIYPGALIYTFFLRSPCPLIPSSPPLLHLLPIFLLFLSLPSPFPVPILTSGSTLHSSSFFLIRLQPFVFSTYHVHLCKADNLLLFSLHLVQLSFPYLSLAPPIPFFFFHQLPPLTSLLKSPCLKCFYPFSCIDDAWHADFLQ